MNGLKRTERFSFSIAGRNVEFLQIIQPHHAHRSSEDAAAVNVQRSALFAPDDPAFIFITVDEGRHMPGDEPPVRPGIVIQPDPAPHELFRRYFRRLYTTPAMLIRTSMAEKEFPSAGLQLLVVDPIAQEGVDAVIPGGKRKERIRENVKASDIRLSKEELQAIDEILNKNE